MIKGAGQTDPRLNGLHMIQEAHIDSSATSFVINEGSPLRKGKESTDEKT
jgi:hypothetical protein